MEYLLKASAVLFIFYVCYQLFLQKETFFQANRWFLLSGLIIACLTPLVVIPVYIEYTITHTSNFFINTLEATPQIIIEKPFDYIQLIIWIYFAGILFFFGKLCSEFLSLRNVLKSSKTKSLGQFKLQETNRNIAPFSFFNRVVYNPKQFENKELTHVINHEKVHCKELHSLDTIIAQITCVLFWFNPISWLYKKALQQNLEFIADQKAQYSSHCKKSYQTVLLKASVKNHQLAITNNFYTSLIKKRIVMLHKSKSKKINQLKLIVVLPLLALFIMSFNKKNIYVEIAAKETNVLIEATDSNEVIEIIITKNANDEDLSKIKEELKSKGITFIYDDIERNSDGEITKINAQFKNNKNSSNYSISGEEGIKSFCFKSDEDSFSVGTIDKNTFLHKAKSGKTKIQSIKGTNKVLVIEDENNSSTIDIKTLKNKDTVYFIKENNKFTFSSDDKDSNIFISESDEPIFIINGKKVEKSVFEDVDSDNIKSVFVLDGKKALDKYGDEGKNGIVIMTRKKSKNLFTEEEDNVMINSNVFSYETDGNEPLFVLNGKAITKDDINNISANEIINVEVLKDESAIKLYGNKAKNGVVIINSKVVADYKNSNNNNFKSVIIEEENSPWAITTQVTSVVFEDDNGEARIELVISKGSTDVFLEQQKKVLKKHGIEAKFSKVKRNKAGEITSIKITLDDNNGRKSSASWKEKDQAIPDIVMGKSKKDKLFVRAIGH